MVVFFGVLPTISGFLNLIKNAVRREACHDGVARQGAARSAGFCAMR
jgi:hypothetical protein